MANTLTLDNISFDDLIPKKETKQEPQKMNLDNVSFDDLIPKDKQKPQARGEETGFLSTLKGAGKAIVEHPMQTLPGAAEALAGGVGGLAISSIGGLAGLGSMALGKGFEKGQQAVEKAAKNIPLEPETEVGKSLSKVLGLVPEAIHKVGEQVYEKTDSPLAGAITEAGLTAVSLFTPIKGAKEIKEVSKSSPMAVPTKVPFLQRIRQAEKGNIADEPYKPNTTNIKTTKNLSEALDWTQSSATADATMLRQNWEKAKGQGYTEEQGKMFRDYSEGSIQELTNDQKAIYDSTIQPLKNEYESIIRQYKDFDLDKEIGARIALGKRSFVDSLLSGDYIGGFGRFAGKPSGMKQRNVFALDDGTVLTVGKGGVVKAWENGESTAIPSKFIRRGDKQVVGRIKEGDLINGKKVVQAKQADIEQHTPIRYLQDDLAVWSIKLTEAKKFARETQLLEDLKKSDYFRANSAMRGEVDIPQDWRKIKGIEKIPQLQDYYFEPRVAEVFDDFIYNNKGDRSSILEGINNLSIKSFMMNPVPHIMNEAAHWYVGRGISGIATPKGAASLLRTIPESLSSVISQDKFQMDMLKHGAPLTYPSVANAKVWNNLLNVKAKEAAKNGTLVKYAKLLGSSPQALFEAITQKSNAIMWASRDFMYTQMVKEHMSKGKSMKEAIDEVNSHMPEYKLPTRVLGSRDLSRLMQNRNLTVFSRYHYGMLKSLGEIGKELSNPKSMVKGLDHLGALIAGMVIVFPAFDAAYQSMFNRQDIKERRSGPFHLIQGLLDMASGEKNATQVITSILTPAPALTLGMELPFNVQMFSKQPIYQEADTPQGKAFDLAKYTTGKLFAPGQAAMSMQEGKMSSEEYALKQLDIETKTKEKQRALDRIKRRKEAQAASRQKKRRKDYGIE